MASASSPDSALSSKISRNHLECSICTERFKEPKILQCLHSFCKGCLKTYATGQHPGQLKIPCPLCRQKTTLPQTGISGLKTNFFITSLMEDITLQEKVADSTKKLTCDICRQDKEATNRCFDCSNNLCTACSQTHQRFSSMATHTIATFDDIQQGKVEYKKQRSMPSCEKHQREVKHFFCENCQVLICRDCTVVDHPGNKGHCVVDASTAAQKLKQSLGQNLQEVIKNTTALQDSKKTALQEEKYLVQYAQRLQGEVQITAEAIRSKVTKEENRLIKEIQDIPDGRQRSIRNFEDEVNARIKRNKHSAEIARDIMSKATDSDFLSLYPEVNRDLQSLCTAPTAVEPDCAPRVHVKWNKNCTNQNIHLGDLVNMQLISVTPFGKMPYSMQPGTHALSDFR